MPINQPAKREMQNQERDLQHSGESSLRSYILTLKRNMALNPELCNTELTWLKLAMHEKDQL